MKVLLMLLIVGCTHPVYSTTTIGISTASIAADWYQTRCSAGNDWRDARGRDTWENNPVLGNKPTTSEIDIYMVTTMVANLIIWKLLPGKTRNIIPTIVTLAEVVQIYKNLEWRGRGCLM